MVVSLIKKISFNGCSSNLPLNPSLRKCILHRSVAKLDAVKTRNRLFIAICVASVSDLAYYLVEWWRGYAKMIVFPFVAGFSDLPHCPYCDNTSLHFPLLEIAALSAFAYGLLSLPSLFRKRSLSTKPSGREV